MRMLWCWRCKMEVPMLDESEYEEAHRLYGVGMRNMKAPLSNRVKRFGELVSFYKTISGWDETEPNAIMHHRISIYGPECHSCAKPFRTPRAAFCAACGHKDVG